MKASTQISLGVLAVTIGVLPPPTADGETKEANQAQQLAGLLNERQATLSQLVEFVEEYRNGTTGCDTVVRATDQLLEGLELAENAQVRITILQTRVELMKSLFSMVEARCKAGQVTESQALAA